MKKTATPFSKRTARDLRAGDRVLITGRLLAVRDASLRKIFASRSRGPLSLLKRQTVFFAGPAPPPPGKTSGAIGPTTTARMAEYFPGLIRSGAGVLIGKGALPPEARRLLVENSLPYLVAVGGAAALLARTVVSSRVIAFPELGAEAVREIMVRDFPAITALDSLGNCLFDRESPR